MSHVRNLFTKTAAARPEPGPALASLPENVAEMPRQSAEPPPLIDFPVEQAQFKPENRLILQSDPRGAAADRFRFLRMRLRELRNTGALQKLLITSPLAGDGKSTMVLNLATVLSERGKHPVLVLEADLRHSSLTGMLGLETWPGLTACLQNDSISPLSTIRRVDPLGWCLLPAGEARKTSTELLQTPAFGHLMERLTPHFDWILIDAPPVIPLTDSILLQHHVQGTLLVVRAGQTPKEAIEQSVTLLGRKKICGVILNAVEARDYLYYKYRYYENRKA
jgi:capsular exopolysaccharide synthesis family protein